MGEITVFYAVLFYELAQQLTTISKMSVLDVGVELTKFFLEKIRFPQTK